MSAYPRPSAVRPPAPAAARPRGFRSRLRRFQVKVRRKVRPVLEVAAFFGAGVSAILQLFTGRMPTRPPK